MLYVDSSWRQVIWFTRLISDNGVLYFALLFVCGEEWYKYFWFISVYGELWKTGMFERMSLQTDEDEHSIEMHLPYTAKAMERY